jgi:hypothetical protein
MDVEGKWKRRDDRKQTYLESTRSYIQETQEAVSTIESWRYWPPVHYFGSPRRYTHSSTFTMSSGSKDSNTPKLAIGHDHTGKASSLVVRG